MAGQRAPVRGQARVRAIEGRLIAVLADAASAALPSRGQVAVTATLDGAEHDLVVEPDGRRGHWLPVPSALDVADGDTIDVVLTVAEQWPEPEPPDDLVQALDGAQPASDTWRDITPMARWEWVRWIDATKNPQTRDRRVEVSVDKLSKGSRRPCCFDLSSCTDPEVSRSGKLIQAD